ncbi:transporter, major facilitator family protein [Dictyocaulus viviparus]|uniref:Transporter, major facilitator family protein n=1 Tax=Dictyocaulus viviparus TaxID=29172 RepID=A0A0D8XSG1_DICVI|nr:transporter, major facilitator family protein [Dictyocaulus viviparus]
MDDTTVQINLIENTKSSHRYSSIPPIRLLCTAILVGLGGPFNFGYQLLITNPSQEAFLQFLNESHFKNRHEFLSREQLEDGWSFIVSIFFWGCTVGAFLIRSLSEKFGRKTALQISHAIQIIACSLTILSFYLTNAAVYAIARFILGFSITISLGIAPMFITECSPKECRGVTSLTTGILLQIALVIGTTLAMPQLLGTTETWWMLYALEMTTTLTVMLFMPFIHDSPGYLQSIGRDDESKKSVSYYHNIDGKALQVVLQQLDEDNNENQQIGLISLWKDPMARRGTLLGAVVAVSMTMSGIAAINAFSFEILLSTGLSAQKASFGNIIICTMNLLGILLSSLAIDRLGRRIILLSTYSLLAVINVIITSLMLGFEYAQVSSFGYPLLATICTFNLSFAAGPGPVSLFITSELVGQNARGAACTWVNVFMSFT